MSVAIPAYDPGRMLELTLDALTRQTVPAEQFEVIVVDDGSDPPLRPVVDRFTDRLDLVYRRHPTNRGRAAARNAALDAARGDVVVFLDADSCAHPDLLRRHRDFHLGRRLEPGVLLGRSLTVDWAALRTIREGRTPEPEEVGEYREDIRDYLLNAPHRRRDWAHVPWLYAFTCNISADRRSLMDVGGFDERLVRWGAEDCELFYRVFHHHDRRPRLFDLDEQAVCFHLPHYRHWPDLTAQLATNQDYLLRKHRRYDIELYGLMGHGGIAIKRILWYGRAVDACRTHDLGRVDRLEATYRDGLTSGPGGGPLLVAGFGASALDLPAGSATFDHAAPAHGDNAHLVGLRTPYETSRFARAVNVDLWRFLTPEDLGGLLGETLRVASRVDLVCTREDVDPAALLPLPFVDDVDYIRAMLEPRFDVSLSRPGATSVLAVSKPR